MTATLTGKIFHFKPGQGYPNIYPTSEPKHRGKGRRSNRLYTLHPVVVVKESWTPPRIEENGTRGNTHDLEHPGDRNHRRDDPGGIGTLPRRPSLNRTDGPSAQVPNRARGTTVQIVNITSRIHPEIDSQNYLPIASPNRPLIQGAKRAFLVPDPGDLEEEAFLRNAIAYDRRSQVNDSSSDRSLASSTSASSYSRSSRGSGPVTPESPDEEVFLAVTPDKAPSTLEFPAAPEPDIQGHLQTKVDNHHDTAALPRDDSFIRLDSRGNVNVADLQPFISPNGHHYSLHETTMDKIWGWIMEAELSFFTSQMEYILENVHDAVKDDAKGAVDRIIEKEVDENFTELSTKLHDLIPPETYTLEVDSLLENFKEKEILTQKVVRDRERVITDTGLKMMGAKVAVEPDEDYEGTPVHEQGNCHDLMGGGPASLSAPVKSSTAMAQEGDVREIDTSNPLASPDKVETHHRLLHHIQRQQAVIEAAKGMELHPQPPKPHHVGHPGEDHFHHVRDIPGQDHLHHVFHQKLLKDAKRQDQLIYHKFREKLIQDVERQDHLISAAFSTNLVPQPEKPHHGPHAGSHPKATKQAKRRGTLLHNEPAAKRLMEHKTRQDHLHRMALSTDLVSQPEKPHHEAHAASHLEAREKQNGKMMANEGVLDKLLEEGSRQRNLHNIATSTELVPQSGQPHHEPHAGSHLEATTQKETTTNADWLAEQIRCQEELRILALHSDLAPRQDKPHHEPHSGSHREAMAEDKGRGPEVELLAILPYNIWDVGSDELLEEEIIPSWKARLVPKPNLGIWNSVVKVSEAMVRNQAWDSRLSSRGGEDTQKPKLITSGRERSDSVDSVETLVDEAEVRSPTWDTRQPSEEEEHVGKVKLVTRGGGRRNSVDRVENLVNEAEIHNPTWGTKQSSSKKVHAGKLELVPCGHERLDGKKALACEAEVRNLTWNKRRPSMQEEHTGKPKLVPCTLEHHGSRRSPKQEEDTTKLKLITAASGFQDWLDGKPSSKQKEHPDGPRLVTFGRRLEVVEKLIVKPRRDSGVAGFGGDSSDAASDTTSDGAPVAASDEFSDASSDLSSEDLANILSDDLSDLPVKLSAASTGGPYDDPDLGDLTQPIFSTTNISCQPKTIAPTDVVSGQPFDDVPVKSSGDSLRDPSDVQSFVEGHKVVIISPKCNAAMHASQDTPNTTVPDARFEVLEHKFEVIAAQKLCCFARPSVYS